MSTRRTVLLSIALVACTPLAAQAGAYPDQPLTIVVPFPAGGSVDAAVRIMQPRLSRELGQSLVIENVSGVGGALGAAKVARAASDGYTLLVGTNNDIVLAPVLNPNVRYKPQDFTPIGTIASTPSLLVARKDLPANSLDEVVEQLRAKPESMTYGSPGVGTFQHLVVEDLQQRAGIRMVHVPYKGASPLVNDILGGQVDLAIVVPSTVLPHIQAGRLKAIGVAQLQRHPNMKGIPALNESRYVKGLDAVGWMGLFAPKGISQERAVKLRDALYATLGDKNVAAQLTAIGMEVSSIAERKGFSERIGRDEAKARSISVKLR